MRRYPVSVPDRVSQTDAPTNIREGFLHGRREFEGAGPDESLPIALPATVACFCDLRWPNDVVLNRARSFTFAVPNAWIVFLGLVAIAVRRFLR